MEQEPRLPCPAWVSLSIAAAALVFVPPVVYQARNFYLGWHDVGNYTRALYNFWDFGRFVTFSDGTGDFFVLQHFEPFFFLLSVPVRLFGTNGYVVAVTGALVLSAGYVFALGAAVGESRWMGAACAAAYIANPYTYAIATCYRVESFGLLFLLAFAYHVRAAQFGRAWLALLLACLVKEDMWLYAVVLALIAGRRDRWKATAALVGGALAYYVVVLQLVGGVFYPTARYFNAFYETDNHAVTKLQIAAGLLRRWHEFAPLLFTGPGLLYQLSFLFIGVFSGWRYAVACGVALLWLTYPGGPPRSNLALYYAYGPLLIFITVLPFALRNLRAMLSRATEARAGLTARWGVAAAMALVLATEFFMHLPGHVPGPIQSSVDPRWVYGHSPGVDVPILRFLISHVLPADEGSVLAQFYTLPSLPQRRVMYTTTYERQRFLDGRLRPKYVLLDLGAEDPFVPREDLSAMVARLREGGVYRALYDNDRVLLYERR